MDHYSPGTFSSQITCNFSPFQSMDEYHFLHQLLVSFAQLHEYIASSNLPKEESNDSTLSGHSIGGTFSSRASKFDI